MNNRPIYDTDLPALQAAIDADTFHPKGTWKVNDFMGFSETFEDSHGPVVFVVYTPEPQSRLRISTMWCTPDEVHRNGRAIIFLVRSAAKRAADAGFNELIFSTTHDKLASFCERALGFVSVGNDEYVLPLEGAGKYGK
jgi:hypothetical protein